MQTCIYSNYWSPSLYLSPLSLSRYNYPFFGNPYPVLIQPPVLPLVGTDQHFSHSFCSFEFATSLSRLEEHITHHPLTVEVWQSHDQSHDQIVGLAQVCWCIFLLRSFFLKSNNYSFIFIQIYFIIS